MVSRAQKKIAEAQVRRSRALSGEVSYKDMLIAQKAEAHASGHLESPHWIVTAPQWCVPGCLFMVRSSGKIGILLSIDRLMSDINLDKRTYRSASEALSYAYTVKGLVDGKISRFYLPQISEP